MVVAGKVTDRQIARAVPAWSSRATAVVDGVITEMNARAKAAKAKMEREKARAKMARAKMVGKAKAKERMVGKERAQE